MRLPRPLRGVAVAGALTLAATSIALTPVGPAAAAQTLSIAEIQGTGSATPYAGQRVSTEPSVVTAVYGSGSGELNGFVIQRPGRQPQRPRAASDAVFVYAGSAPITVRTGDAVSVTGTAGEYQGLTQLSEPQVTVLSQRLPAPTPIGIAWERTADTREAFESMLYRSRENFTVADTFPLLRFGELGLTAGRELPYQPTDVAPAGSAEAAAQAERNATYRVQLDDGTNRGYTVTSRFAARQLPYLSADEPVAVGDRVRLDEPVIVDYRNGGWKLNPTRPVDSTNEPATITPRRTPAAPEVGGDVSIASFNVLNYFPSTGSGASGCNGGNLSTDGSFNVTFDCDRRGAWDDADLARQQAKIVTAINELDASVTGLSEIENSAALGDEPDAALADLVQALNADAGREKWAFVPSSSQLPDVADQDVITNAIIYQPALVDPEGEAWALGAEAGAGGAFANARTPIAQSFAPADDGRPFLVVVNHFKSKGSAPTSGPDADTGDGQGAWNATRVAQAEALLEWVPDVQDATGATDVALVGDFNSYTAEDPMQVFYDAGWSNVAPEGSYTYTFQGLAGSLDHVLLNPDARERMDGAAVWNINAGQSTALEYSQYRTTALDYHRDDARRSSDHDPVKVSLERGVRDAELTILNINDFHGRIARSSPNTVAFLGTVEEQRAAAGEGSTLFLSAGDSIGGSLFASFAQQDNPTLDLLDAADLDASAVGNHEFDRGYADLTGRVAERADFDYLGANVYRTGTTTPALPEYAVFERSGLTVGVVGAVTAQTQSLVSPAGITDIEFGDPVEAVNRVTAQLKDGDPANGEADVVIAEYHDGATVGDPDSTLEEQLAEGGPFADIVTGTSPEVAAIFTAHTHQSYAWDAPVPGTDRTRPVMQSGSYGAAVGKVVLRMDADGEVRSYTRANLAATTTPVPDLVARYPRVAEVQSIVDETLTVADEIGREVIGQTTAPITRALPGGVEDRAAESTLTNLVADMFRATTADRGTVVGVQNPGGTRADLDAGDITYGEAAAVLPFANTVMTATLTGEQFVTMLEQQWQTNPDGTPVTSGRPYLQLGLSSNVGYTFDASRPLGDRITSVTIDGEPIDPAGSYQVASGSFLISGGDNFHVFDEASDKADSGQVDLQSWTDHVRASSPLSPSFAKRAVQVSPTPGEVAAGGSVTFTVSGLDLTSTGSPTTTSIEATLGESALGSTPVQGGTAEVTVTVPAGTAAGATTLVLTTDTGTTVRLPITVTG